MPILTTLRRAAALLIAAAAINAPASGQTERWAHLADTVFEHYTQALGLPQPQVMALAEDGDGFLWVGTQGGLARWDGYRFRTYKSNSADETTLPDNWITVLHADPRGRLWIGTSADGLARYDRGSDSFVRVKGLSHPHVTALVDDGEGGLWIGTDGGLNHLGADGALAPAVRREDKILALLRDRKGALWLGTRAGLMRRDLSGDFVPVSLGSKAMTVKSLFEGADGRLWIGTDQHGAAVLEPGADTPRPIEESGDTPSLAGETVDIIEAAGPGEVWLATNGHGIVAVDTASWRTRRIRHDQRVPNTLGHDYVRSLFRDRSGSLWVGTTRGLDHLIDGHGAIHTVIAMSDPEGGLTGTDILSVMPTPDGHVWLGFGQTGIDIVDPATGQVERIGADPTHPDSALPRDSVFAFERDGASVYIGTNRGLYRADMRGHGLTRIRVPNREIGAPTGVVRKHDGVLWIGGREDGLWALPLPDTESPFPAGRNWLPGQRILSLTTDAEGSLWIGTLGGLHRLDQTSGEIEAIRADASDPAALMPGFVSALAVDHQGRLWVGVLGGGIAVMTGRDGEGKRLFHRIGLADGMPSANIDRLLVDESGRVWASTASTLALVDPDSFAVRPLGRADGVALTQYWVGSGAASGGEVVFGGAGGLTVVRPDRLPDWDYRPPVVITDLRAGGKPVPAGRYASADGKNPPLEIAPDANSLVAEFSALDYSAPERNRYAYRLEGFDRDWTETDSTRRLATYNNLPPGTYTLRLRGSNRNGAFGERSLALPIRVLPAWYQTWWCRALAALALLLATFAIVQVRTAYLRRRQRALEQEVADRTADLNRSMAEVVEKSDQIARLLDNSGEGFLSFGADLVVDPDYSRACEILLGTVPAGRDAATLLFGGEEKQAEFLRQAVPKILALGDPLRRAVMLSLLPDEITSRGHVLEARYTVIETGRLMVVLRDITEQRGLASKVERERRRLEMIAAAVTDQRDFFDTLDAFRAFARRDLPRLLETAVAPGLIVRELYRQIHTFKGLLAHFHLHETPLALQALEDRLSALDGRGEPLLLEEVRSVAGSVPYEDLLERDLTSLRDALGKDFLDRGDTVILTSAQAKLLQELIERLRRGEPVDLSAGEIGRLCDEIGTLRLLTLRSALDGFDRVLQQVAHRRDKVVAPLEIQGGETVKIDPDRFGPFLRSLVHVFRNAVVHGIETPDQRVTAGKPEAGHIRCSIETEGQTIRLAITDDGAGIDVAALRGRAVESGFLSRDEESRTADEDILEMVFRDAVSTEITPSDLAGRGVGLSAVRAEVSLLGGRVTVSSRIGEGSRLEFILPI